MANLNTIAPSSTFAFSQLSDRYIYKTAQASSLGEATRIQSFSDLIDRIKDWFLGGVQKRTIAKLFADIQDIKFGNSSLERLDKFVEIRNSVKLEYQDFFTLEIKCYGKNDYEYSLKIDDATIFRCDHLCDVEGNFLKQLRSYVREGRIAQSQQGEVNKIVQGQEGDYVAALLKETSSATASKMKRADGKFSPSDQLYQDAMRGQRLDFVKGMDAQENFIDFSNSVSDESLTPEENLAYMDHFLDQLRQITNDDEVAFELTRHMQQGAAASLYRAQLAYPTILAPLNADAIIRSDPELRFGVEKVGDKGFDITVQINYNTISHILTPSAEKIKQYMDSSRSYCYAQFKMHVAADGKQVLGLSQPLTLNYQLTKIESGQEYGGLSKTMLDSIQNVVSVAVQPITPKQILAVLTNDGQTLGGKTVLNQFLAIPGLLSGNVFSSDHIELDVEQKALIFKNVSSFDNEIIETLNQLTESGALLKNDDGSLAMTLDARIFSDSNNGYGGIYVQRLLMEGQEKFSSLNALAELMTQTPSWNFQKISSADVLLKFINPTPMVPGYHLDKDVAERLLADVGGLKDLVVFDEDKNKFVSLHPTL